MKIVIIKARNPKEKIISQPIGALYIASIAKELNCDILFLDQAFYSYSEIQEKIKKFGVDILGISSMIHEYQSVAEITNIVKKINPKAIIITGGPYPSSFPYHCLKETKTDIAVFGEGELSFKELIKIYQKNKTIFCQELDNIKSLIFIKINNQIKKYGKELYIDNLDTVPEPAREFLEFEKYKNFHPHTPLLFGSNYADIVTSRGCEFKCIFCHNIHGKKFRAHSPERVISEILSIKEKYKINNIQILDDCFNYDKKRSIEILKKIKELNLNIFICGIRVDLLTKEEIELMKEAGVKYIGIGIETADEKLQNKIKKNINLKNAKKNILLISKKKIFMTAGIIFGYREENLISWLKTLFFVYFNNIHSIMVASLKIYPNTEIAIIEKELIKKPELIDTLYTDYFNNDYINKIHFLKILLFKYLTNFLFYTNPKKIYLIFRDIPFLNSKLISLLLKKFIERLIPIR